jgi:single-strand DNA-binding protein
MSLSLNKAQIIGNLTRDPELKTLPSGQAVASFSLAVNRVWKDKDGKKQEAAEFINIIVFGKTAELAAQYLKKGQQALVEGRIQTRSWDKDGQKQYRTEIVADMVQFGSKLKAGSDADQDTESSQQDALDLADEEIDADDVPF